MLYKSEWVWVHCEGSGRPTGRFLYTLGTCKVCGLVLPGRGLAPEHDRIDGLDGDGDGR